METPGAEVRQHAGGKALGGSGDNTAIATPSTVAASPDPALSPLSFASASAPSHHSDHETPDALQSLQLQPGRTAMSIVHQAYGPGADLYRDILRVGPAATDREIRTAYFRRGRQVLQQPDVDAVLVQQKRQKQKQEESTAAEEEHAMGGTHGRFRGGGDMSSEFHRQHQVMSNSSPLHIAPHAQQQQQHSPPPKYKLDDALTVCGDGVMEEQIGFLGIAGEDTGRTERRVKKKKDRGDPEKELKRKKKQAKKAKKMEKAAIMLQKAFRAKFARAVAHRMR